MTTENFNSILDLSRHFQQSNPALKFGEIKV